MPSFPGYALVQECGCLHGNFALCTFESQDQPNALEGTCGMCKQWHGACRPKRCQLLHISP